MMNGHYLGYKNLPKSSIALYRKLQVKITINALKLFENTIAKTSRFPGMASLPSTATRRKTDRFSGRFKAVGFESLPNRVTGH